MSDTSTTIDDLRQLARQFVDERDWRQFHSPKNLAMGMAIEAAELMEHFQWIDVDESRQVADDSAKRAAAAEELADVFCYCLIMADELGIDIADTLRAKMVKNALKYPADEYRGRYGTDDVASREGKEDETTLAPSATTPTPSAQPKN